MVKKMDTGVLIAKNYYKPYALAKPNVIGIGMGYRTTGGKKTKDEAVVVFVEKKMTPAALSGKDMIDSHVIIKGVPTPIDVVELGKVEALKSRTDVWRPAQGGVSIGHYKITAGTLGVIAKDKYSGARVILSNNHVLANSNDAKIGDAIYQPGPIDGGTEENRIANLYRFQRIDFGEDDPTCDLANMYIRFGNFLSRITGSSHKISAKKVQEVSNLVDAAIAMPLDDSLVADNIIDIGEIDGIADASLGLQVYKSGRTTEFTEGRIEYVGATIQVSYGGNKVATFDDQLVTGYMSQGGDSGSLLVNGNDKAVGLLFAGSNTSTIYNPIKYVLDALSIEL